MESKYRKVALEWFVSFANLDLMHIGSGDRAKLLVEAKKYLIDYSWINFVFKEKPRAPLPSWPWEDERKFWKLILKAHGLIRQWLEAFLQPAPRCSMDIPGRLYLQWDTGVYHTVTFPISKTPEEFLKAMIVNLMEGLPTSVLRKCSVCRNYFINFRGRKVFCSSRCMWKQTAEKRREAFKKDPAKHDAYKKKQREIMAARYRSKAPKNAQVGKNARGQSRREVS